MAGASRFPPALTLVLAALAAPPAPAGAGGLGPQRAREGVLAAGEARSYVLEAAPGELVRVTVDERGADLSARLYAAGGALLQLVETPGTADGLARLFAWSEGAARYRLELRASSRGRFRVAQRARAPSGAEAEPWVAAERLLAQAQELQGAGEDGRRAALELYQESLAAWQALGDGVAEAEALTLASAVGGFLEEPRRKLDALGRALPLWRAAGNAYREAWTLAEMGVAHGALGEAAAEQEHHERALLAWRALGDRRGEARALIALGACHHDLGDMQAALDLVNEGLALGRRLGDSRVEAEGLRRLAGLRRDLGETRRAIALMERSRALWRAAGDRYREALALANLATGHREAGRHAQALQGLETVLAMAQEQGHVHLTAAALANLGTHHRLRGERDAARRYYEQAQALFQRQGQPWDQSQVVRRLGEIDEAEGRFSAASERYQEALRLGRQTANPRTEAEVLYCLARMERARGRLDQAAAHIESALAIVEGLRATLARQDFRAAYLASVLRFYELAIDVSVDLERQSPGEGHAADALHRAERARARSFLETLGEAQGHIRRGADPGLLARRRGLDRALRRAPRAEVDGLLERLRDVEADIRRTSPRYAELVLPQPLQAADIQKQITDDDTVLLEYALGEERSHLWLVTRGALAHRVLPPRPEIEAMARRFHGLFQPRRFEAADERRARRRRAAAEYPRLAAALGEMVLGPAAPWLHHRRLVVVADGALQYVPFAALLLPEAHPARAPGAPAAPLVTAHEVVHLPSASTLAALPRTAGAAPGTVAVVADPVYDASDPRVDPARRGPARPLPPALQRSLDDVAPGRRLARLAFTRREAEAILALVPASSRRAALGFEASRRTVAGGALAGHAIVHFATHSLVNGIHPELSGLVLSLVDRQGRPQDGFLRAHEVFDMELDAGLVVLSGCSTGLGRETRGEGLHGLTRGFMYAGAAGVVVSLWDVHDEATAAFMERFYGGLLGRGLSPAAALRGAQLESLRDHRWSAPEHWAPFVLQGEWRR
jgi:CHAT domain-containing protein/tetratricopeptide (TPR) repeat protein